MSRTYTKMILISSAVFMGCAGLILSFAPELILTNLQIELSQTSLIFAQVTGGLYLGFSMLNWMTKKSPIGGIYNRPIAMANFLHFLISGISILKVLLTVSDLPKLLWVVGIIYILFGLMFMKIFFTNPNIPK